MSVHDDHHPSAWGPHDWSHGAPHNSWAPFIMSVGFGIFLFSLAGVYKWGEMVDAASIGVATSKIILLATSVFDLRLSKTISTETS